jgi:uncharacterized protein (DUF2267 family)
MSTSALAVLDHTVQETNVWLKAIGEQLQLDRHDAYIALRAVLHALRDRLPPEVAVHLGAQLRMLIRAFITKAGTWPESRQKIATSKNLPITSCRHCRHNSHWIH